MKLSFYRKKATVDLNFDEIKIKMKETIKVFSLVSFETA